MHPRYAFTAIRAAFLLLLLMLGAARLAGAQPTITEATYRALMARPNTVTMFDAQNAEVLRPVTAMRGGGHVFNFAETPFTPIDTARYTPFTCSASIPGCDLPTFAAASLMLRREGHSAEETSYGFYVLHPSSMRILGSAARYDFDDARPGEETLIARYAPAAREAVFPLNATRTWTDAYTLEIAEQGTDPLITTQFETHTAVVAWGTLVTPSGSAPALMLQRAERTTTNFLGNTIRDTLVHYTFVSEGGLQASITVDPESNQIDAGYTTYVATSTPREPESRVTRLTLDAPTPNPARGPVRLGYTLDAPRDVTLTVHDALGREVARLAEGMQPAGTHAATWDAAALPSGLYLVRLQEGGAVQTRAVTIVR